MYLYYNLSFTRYDEIERLLSERIIQSNKTKTREDWKNAIAHAHKVSSLYTHTDNHTILYCRNMVLARQKYKLKSGILLQSNTIHFMAVQCSMCTTKGSGHIQTT